MTSLMHLSVLENGVSIKGVCYFLWDRDNEGKCKIETHYKGKILSSETRYLLEDSNQTFIRYGKSYSNSKKIKKFKEKAFHQS